MYRLNENTRKTDTNRFILNPVYNRVPIYSRSKLQQNCPCEHPNT